MLTPYNTLRNKYIVDGYEQAYEYITELQAEHHLPQTLLTNFYCYIIIQAEFKAEEILAILENCMNMEECKGSIRALTLYHIASVHFKKKELSKCRTICQQIFQQFMGLYYSIETRLQKSPEQITLSRELQQIIYYVFLMMAYISKKENNLKDSNIYLDAGKRILKDKKDVLCLTTKTTVTTLETEGSLISAPSPNIKQCKNVLAKENIDTSRNAGGFLKQSQPMNTC